MKYIASCSFGKDSLAMILTIIEHGLPLDEVVFYDTGMEFQALYNVRDAVLPLLRKNGIRYIELHPDRPFLYDMLERPVKGREHRGYAGVAAFAGGGLPASSKPLTDMQKALAQRCMLA